MVNIAIFAKFDLSNNLSLINCIPFMCKLDYLMEMLKGFHYEKALMPKMGLLTMLKLHAEQEIR